MPRFDRKRNEYYSLCGHYVSKTENQVYNHEKDCKICNKLFTNKTIEYLTKKVTQLEFDLVSLRVDFDVLCEKLSKVIKLDESEIKETE